MTIPKKTNMMHIRCIYSLSHLFLKMLAYEGFCQSILDKKATAVVLVDDYGNMCGIAYLFMDQDHITSGSG